MNDTKTHGDEPKYLKTHEAANCLRFKPQTLRKWACTECGPIRPVRVAGRLLWRRSDIDSLLAGEKVAA